MQIRVRQNAFDRARHVKAVSKLVVEMDDGKPIAVFSEMGGRVICLKAGEKGFDDAIRAIGGKVPDVEVIETT